MCPELGRARFDTSPSTHTAAYPSSSTPLMDRVSSPTVRTLTPGGGYKVLINDIPDRPKGAVSDRVHQSTRASNSTWRREQGEQTAPACKLHTTGSIPALGDRPPSGGW